MIEPPREADGAQAAPEAGPAADFTAKAAPEAAAGAEPREEAPNLDRRLAELDAIAVRGVESDERKLTPENVRREGLDPSGYEFGPYRILGEIARGGMGVLYRASQTTPLTADPKAKLPEEVALKVIVTRAGALAAAADTERFIREIRVLITLNHPNIVRIWDAGKENGLHYYTMELIRGESLKELVRDRSLPIVMSLAIVREIASALDALHRAGMLHRDVKPANILMDRQASPFRPVLIDFGLIKGKFAGKLTAGAGEVAGTPAYMAPEATEALGEVGPPSDLYALGAVLYYLITRRSPFQGSRADEVIQKVRTEAPKPPSAIVRGLPKPIEDMVLHCLAKRPADRFASMRDLIAALDVEIKGARRAIHFENLLLRYRRKFFGSA